MRWCAPECRRGSWRPPAGEGVGGERVAQIVKSEVRQSRLFQDHLHPVVGCTGADRLFRRKGLREDPLTDGVLLPLRQPRRSAGWQMDGPPAPAGLGLPDLQFTSLWHVHRAEDLQRPRLFIKVLPHQSADLTPAQAGGQFGVEEIPPELFAEYVNERLDLYLSMLLEN